MSVNKIVTKVDGTINKTIDFNDLKSGLAAGSHTITVEAFNGATLVNSQTRNITIAAGGYDADYQAVLDYATANSIAHPDSAQKTIDNQLVVDLKANGLWTKADVFINYGGTASTAFRRICWKRLLQVDLFGGLTWSADGIEGNGTNGYVNLKFKPFTNGVNWILEDAGIAANLKKGAAITSNLKAIAGAYDGSSSGYTLMGVNSTKQYYIINGEVAAVPTITYNIGLNGLYRSGGNNIGIGSSVYSAEKVTVAPLLDIDLFMLARNSGGTADLFSDERVKHLYLGASLSETEHNTLESILP